MSRRARGQVVVLAAAVIALALVPLVAAYLQLGYAADLRAESDEEPIADADRSLRAGVTRIAGTLPAEYAWTERDRAAEAVRTRLTARMDALGRSGAAGADASYRLTYDRRAAADWAARRCPDGANRQFGDCVVRDGVVVQERADRTHLVAVAVDVRIVGASGTSRATLIVRPPGGR